GLALAGKERGIEHRLEQLQVDVEIEAANEPLFGGLHIRAPQSARARDELDEECLTRGIAQLLRRRPRHDCPAGGIMFAGELQGPDRTAPGGCAAMRRLWRPPRRRQRLSGLPSNPSAPRLRARSRNASGSTSERSAPS